MLDIQKEFLENRNKNRDVWRIFKIISDFTDAFVELDSLGPAVSIFGSARATENDFYYKKTTELAKKLAENGYAIITGGGPGIMEAGNKGAYEAGGVSIGLNIELPHEQHMNKFVNEPLNFKYFFTRKTIFMKYAVSFIIMPGGFGTMDELFESLVLTQTKKMTSFPIVLFGKEFWSPLLSFFNNLINHKYIDKEDLDLFMVTDSIEEAIEFIKLKTDIGFPVQNHSHKDR